MMNNVKHPIFGGYMEMPNDGILFGFNPCFVTFSGITETTRVHIHFVEASAWGENNDIGSIAVNLHNGYAHVDVAAYLRAEFAGIAKGSDVFRTSARVSMKVSKGDNRYISNSDYTIIYGAMLPGETFNPSKTVRLWSAYPQVVSFYHGNQGLGETLVFLQKDDKPAAPYTFTAGEAEDAGISNYDNGKETDPIKRDGQIVVYPGGKNTLTTFTMEHDGTFTGIVGETIINIIVDNRPQCDDHVFLRWVDKYGFWQYWLCKIGEEQYTDAVVGEALTFLQGTHYPYYATRNLGKNLVKQVTACATSLTEEEWRVMASIKGSVNVCAFDTASQSWIPVSIAAGASTWKMGNQASHRQDFPLKIVYPNIQTQRL